MNSRSLFGSACRPRDEGLCIVSIGNYPHEVDQLRQCLEKLKNGRLFDFSHPGELVDNLPAGRVDMVSLSAARVFDSTRKVLRWTRRQWPMNLTLVVGLPDCGRAELAAREYGAFYLARPVQLTSWQALIDSAQQVQLADLKTT